MSAMQTLSREINNYQRRHQLLLKRSSKLVDMSPSSFREFEKETDNFYKEVKEVVMAAAQEDEGGENEDTDMVNCVYDCESEYSNCQEHASTFLCSLQGLSCILKCGVEMLGRRGYEFETTPVEMKGDQIG
jgi:hypothetical protein